MGHRDLRQYVGLVRQSLLEEIGRFTNVGGNPDVFNSEAALLDAGTATGFPITVDLYRFLITKGDGPQVGVSN